MNPCWWYHWLNKCDSLNGYIRIFTVFLFLFNGQSQLNSTQQQQWERKEKSVRQSAQTHTKKNAPKKGEGEKMPKHTDEMNMRVFPTNIFPSFRDKLSLSTTAYDLHLYEF